METKEKKITLYYIAIAIVTIKVILNTSQLIIIPEYVDNILTIFISFLFFLKLFAQKYTKKQIVIISIIGVLVLYISIVCNEYVIALTYLAIISIKGIEIKKVVKIMFITKLILISTHIIIYCLSLNENTVMYYTSNGEARHTLFLGHPNTVAGIIMWMIMEYIYLKYEKVNIMTYLGLIILDVAIYYLTKSRTVLIAFSIFIILLIISKKIKNKQILIAISRRILLILSLIIISLSVFYSKIPNIDYVDQLLSRRISLGKIAIDNYGLTLLPHEINYDVVVKWEDEYEMNLVLDSLYIRSAVSYGLIVLILIVYGFHKKSRYITIREAVFIILFAITGITENYVLNTYICFPLMFLGYILYEKREEKNKYE